MHPSVSIIVPVYNAHRTLADCLDALQRFGNDAEIIVVDDASTDGSVDIARSFGNTVITCAENSGPGPARNLGAARASGEILVFVDADVVAPAVTLHALVEELSADATLDALFGSYDDDPFDPTWISQYRNLLHHYTHQNGPDVSTHFWSGFGAIKARSFERVGGFSDGYFGRFSEDIELGYRMRALGMTIGCNATLQVKHLKKWTLGSMLKVDFIFRGVAWTQLLYQNRHFPRDFSLAPVQVISSILTLALGIVLVIGYWMPAAGLAAAALILVFTVVNYAFFRFLAARRGWLFTIFSIVLHFLYHANAAVAFAVGSLAHANRRPAIQKQTG